MLISPHPTPAAAALAWADRLYRDAATFPQTYPDVRVEDALEAYRQVERRYPRSTGLRLGIGNCLMSMGLFEDAALVFPTGPSKTEALHRIRLKKRCAHFAKGRSVLQLERIPGTTNGWVALLGQREDARKFEPRDRWFSLSVVGILHLRERPKGFEVAGKERPIPDPEPPGPYCRLAVTDLGPGRSPAAIVVQPGLGMQYEPKQIRIYRITRAGLSRPMQFMSEHQSRLVPSTNRRGFRMLLTPGYKNDWADVYEWKNERFVLANRESGDLYRQTGSDREFTDPSFGDPKSLDSSYEPWAKRAAISTILGSRQRAIHAWRQAAVACRIAVRMGTDYPRATWYGDAKTNLAQILRRIRWLQRGELTHPLLYRPCDSDLQVPPYKLGHAGDSR